MRLVIGFVGTFVLMEEHGRLISELLHASKRGQMEKSVDLHTYAFQPTACSCNRTPAEAYMQKIMSVAVFNNLVEILYYLFKNSGIF
jgi:hypothetical protein